MSNRLEGRDAEFERICSLPFPFDVKSGPKANSTALNGGVIFMFFISDIGSMGGLYVPELIMRSIMKHAQKLLFSIASEIALLSRVVVKSREYGATRWL